jgi:hypothetical protein
VKACPHMRLQHAIDYMDKTDGQDPAERDSGRDPRALRLPRSRQPGYGEARRDGEPVRASVRASATRSASSPPLPRSTVIPIRSQHRSRRGCVKRCACLTAWICCSATAPTS